MSNLWTWVVSHPAEAAWAAVGVLTVLVLGYRTVEDRLKEWSLKTTNTVDNRILQGIGQIVGLTTVILDLVREILPHFAAKPRETVIPAVPVPTVPPGAAEALPPSIPPSARPPTEEMFSDDETPTDPGKT
jgi:hypothetical protein